MNNIYIRSLSKSYGAKKVLENFSAEIPLNGKTVIMGESGCGKTTLINILMGFERSDGGEIEAMPEKISAVFQDDCLSEDFSSISNLRAVVGKKLSKEALSGYLFALGLARDDIIRPVRELSGGMKRRVAIARALVADSDFVIMDEPFKGLDEELRGKVVDFILDDIKNKNRGLLIITHDPDEIDLLFADKVILMD